MATNAWQAYQETEIASADGLELVELLYRAAVEAVQRARAHVRQGEIAGRSRQITRASAILSELAGALDFERGGELSRNLAALYAYAQERLVEANTRQIEAPLAEVELLLSTLLDGWRDCRRLAGSAPPASGAEYAPLACTF